MNYEEATFFCREKLKSGESIENLIPFLKESGFQIFDSIKILKEVGNISLGESKKIVTGHDVWKELSKQMDKFHEAIINDLAENLK